MCYQGKGGIIVIIIIITNAVIYHAICLSSAAAVVQCQFGNNSKKRRGREKRNEEPSTDGRTEERGRRPAGRRNAVMNSVSAPGFVRSRVRRRCRLERRRR